MQPEAARLRPRADFGPVSLRTRERGQGVSPAENAISVIPAHGRKVRERT
jgi:hypothetical protein